MVFKTYYQLSKPGIVYANIITAVAGYLLASRFAIRPLVFVGLLLGLTLVIIGACASNNLIDRRLDAQMPRTRRRALVTGAISPLATGVYASLTTLAGLAVLLVTQNRLTVLLAVIAWLDYVVLYGYGKRHSVHGTLVGCISGAIPLVAGYTAMVGRLDVTAWLLFGLMVVWQMGHFYGIALYRLKDYRAGSIPVMPAVHGTRSTQWQALIYIGLFIIVGFLLGVKGHLGIVGGIVLVISGCYWLYRAVSSLGKLTPELWGKRVFLTSLVVMLLMATTLSVCPLLV